MADKRKADGMLDTQDEHPPKRFSHDDAVGSPENASSQPSPHVPDSDVLGPEGTPVPMTEQGETIGVEAEAKVCGGAAEDPKGGEWEEERKGVDKHLETVGSGEEANTGGGEGLRAAADVVDERMGGEDELSRSGTEGGGGVRGDDDREGDADREIEEAAEQAVHNGVEAACANEVSGLGVGAGLDEDSNDGGDGTDRIDANDSGDESDQRNVVDGEVDNGGAGDDDQEKTLNHGLNTQQTSPQGRHTYALGPGVDDDHDHDESGEVEVEVDGGTDGEDSAEDCGEVAEGEAGLEGAMGSVGGREEESPIPRRHTGKANGDDDGGDGGDDDDNEDADEGDRAAEIPWEENVPLGGGAADLDAGAMEHLRQGSPDSGTGRGSPQSGEGSFVGPMGDDQQLSLAADPNTFSRASTSPPPEADVEMSNVPGDDDLHVNEDRVEPPDPGDVALGGMQATSDIVGTGSSGELADPTEDAEVEGKWTKRKQEVCAERLMKLLLVSCQQRNAQFEAREKLRMQRMRQTQQQAMVCQMQGQKAAARADALQQGKAAQLAQEQAPRDSMGTADQKVVAASSAPLGTTPSNRGGPPQQNLPISQPSEAAQPATGLAPAQLKTPCRAADEGGGAQQRHAAAPGAMGGGTAGIGNSVRQGGCTGAGMGMAGGYVPGNGGSAFGNGAQSMQCGAAGCASAQGIQGGMVQQARMVPQGGMMQQAGLMQPGAMPQQGGMKGTSANHKFAPATTLQDLPPYALTTHPHPERALCITLPPVIMLRAA